jgi:hypothetical protein
MMYDSIIGCSAQFLLFPDTTANHYTIINNAVGIPPIHYLWSWGDNTFDTIPYPSHTYADTGIYTICLTITDSTGCQSTFCDSSYNVMRIADLMAYINVIPNPSGIKNLSVKAFSVNLFPNPSNTIINILLSSLEPNETLQITDVLGRKIEQLLLSGITTSIDVSKWSEGVYFYLVRSDKGEARGKFVVQK